MVHLTTENLHNFTRLTKGYILSVKQIMKYNGMENVEVKRLMSTDPTGVGGISADYY